VSELPGGTVTFVFADVEGSTRLVRELREQYGDVLADYHRLLREAVSAHGGREVDSHGDGFFAAFLHARNAVLAAVDAQRALAVHEWPEAAPLRARMGIHTGAAEVSSGRYVGVAVHRAARICSAGSGGQVLVSQATVSLLDDEKELPGLELHDLGERPLKDFERAVRVYCVAEPGLVDADEPSAAQAQLPAVRASDADRERVVAELREHTAAGRLTLEEFSARIERVYVARILEELDDIGRDLPSLAGPAAPAQTRRRATRLTGVLFGYTRRAGRLRLPRFSFAFVAFGDVDLDLRRAELSGSVASVVAFVLFGNIDVYVPEGVEVDLGGFTAFGHRREWGRDVDPHPSTLLLRVKVFSLFGTSDVWRVPASWAGRTFREVIRAMRAGEHRELPRGS
jgi:class 3 adenylate cyclase